MQVTESRLIVAMVLTDGRDDHNRHSLPEPFFGTAPTALLAGLEQMPQLEFHIVSCVHKQVQEFSRIGNNIFHHAVHVPTAGWLRGAYIGCISGVRRVLRKIRPDLVHGQGTERYCALSAAFSGFPNLVTIHGNMRRVADVNHAKPFSFLWLTAWLERLTLPRTGGVICLSTHTRREVETLARRTWLVPNAVDPAFLLTPRILSSGDPPTLLCVGHICALKNQIGLIRALDPIATQREIRLVFLGSIACNDPAEIEFRELLRTRPWCIHAGFADRAMLRDHLSRATLLVHPSFEENCPMVVLEAMAAGLPITASAVGGIPDLFIEGIHGFFFDPARPDSMAAAVMRLLDDPVLAARLGANAREHVQHQFHPTVIAQRHIEIYQKLRAESARTR